MSDPEVARKREQAELARRLAKSITDDELAQKLRREAEKFSSEAGVEEWEDSHGKTPFPHKQSD